MTRQKEHVLPTFSFLCKGALNAACLAALAGCGGGGGSDGAADPIEVPVQPVVEPITTVPDSSYSGIKLAAFIRLNEARIAAGVSAVRQNAQLDAAAQAHALYLSRNYLTGHNENAQRPYFTGITAHDRASVHGYQGTLVTELIEYELGIDSGVPVERYLNSVYHLAGALNPRANEVGIGRESTTAPAYYIANPISLGGPVHTLKPIDDVWVWPVDGAVDTPNAFKPVEENPNPLPDIAPDASVSVARPVMFCGAKGNYAALAVTAISFGREGQSSLPDIRLLRHSDVDVPSIPGIESVVDENIVNNFPSMKSCIFLVAKTPLEKNATYTVAIAATQAGEPIGKTWSFTTRP